MFLGLDLGTSGLKALLIDGDGSPVASATAPLTIRRPHPGWAEQDPDDWIAAATAALDELARERDLSAVRGLGMSGQQHGATLLGEDDRPLRPCMLWNDTRAHAEAAAMDADPAFRRIAGNIVFPGFTAPKVEWVRRNEPATFGAVRTILLPKDYLRLWLTGERVSDMSDASGTGWLDVAARAWSPDLLDRCHLTPGHMPRLVEGSEPGGVLRADLAARWGLGRVAVAGSAGDNAAAACGTGIVAPGSAMISIGTSGTLFTATDEHRAAPETAVHAFCHALPGTWHQMTVHLSATDALNWLAERLGEDAGTLATMASADVDERAPLFLPYLGGERTPHNDSNVRAALVGLSHETDRAALATAVMEGVAMAFRDGLDALKAAGTAPQRLIAVGGGSRSAAWLQLIADTLATPVDVPGSGELGAAFGAARLGRMAATGEDAATACPPPAIARTVPPRAESVDVQDTRHARFAALYRAFAGGADDVFQA